MRAVSLRRWTGPNGRLQRIERAIAQVRRKNGKDEELRAKVREAVAELDQIIRDGGERLMAEIDVFIAGRAYKVACRDGEEEFAAQGRALVDAKSREALAGLGTLSEARQLLFASLLLADEWSTSGRGPTAPPPVDPALAERAERARRSASNSLAAALENEGHQRLNGSRRVLPGTSLRKSLRRLNILGDCPCPDPGPVHMAPT